MSELELTSPMDGCKAVAVQDRTVLFGQPPEVLKALIKSGASPLDAMVLPDVRERSGALLNNLEFPLYYFLFMTDGLKHGRRLKLIGEPEHLAHAMEQLRLTLLGPHREELEAWDTDPKLREEWLNAGEFFALKDDQGAVRPVEHFIEPIPFHDNRVELDGYHIERLGTDRFVLGADAGSVEIDLNEVGQITPPYEVYADNLPGPLCKFGIDVLGGASGFTPEEASTGLVLCFNGWYVLIDSIPFADWHLRARGISRNQIRALFLTHIHDDHCSMLPLMQMSHRIEVITTRAIYEMAMQKLALGLGWTAAAVKEHFRFLEITPGRPFGYYGLNIDAHCAVHSVPTIGAVFSASREGQKHQICVVGDNQSFAEIEQMSTQQLIRPDTEAYLKHLYRAPFDMLVADGGMGLIHGDPADALQSEAERVVFVHVDRLPNRYNATFSLASSGKRYTILEGGNDLYTMRAIELLMENFGEALSGRWLSSLFADTDIRHFNTDDVILKQGWETRGNVLLILTGHCRVIHHDGEQLRLLATREAGEFVGEMAVVTGSEKRNASVVAATPVTVCEFREDSFGIFIEKRGLKEALLAQWGLRETISVLPQFAGLSTTVIDALSAIVERRSLEPGQTMRLDDAGGWWAIISAGRAIDVASGELLGVGDEAGFMPHAPQGSLRLKAKEKCIVLGISAMVLRDLLAESPQFNFSLRQYREGLHPGRQPWSLTLHTLADGAGSGA